LPRQAGLEDLEVGRIVVDYQDARRVAHDRPPILQTRAGTCGSWQAAGAG
jgi:hypothetical protein